MEAKHCVIAIFFGDHYISVLCYLDHDTRISKTLRKNHNTVAAAEALISKGDIADITLSPIAFCSEKENCWPQIKPTVHETPMSMAEYCIAVGAEYLHVFENEQWDTISLIRTDIDDYQLPVEAVG